VSLLTDDVLLIGSGLALLRIADKARAGPDALHTVPHGVRWQRLDEVNAAKDLVLRYAPGARDRKARDGIYRWILYAPPKNELANH
jgi:hypothetical protein